MSNNDPMTQERIDAIRGRLSDVGAPWEFAPTPDGDGGEVIRVGEQGGPIAWGIDIDAAGLIAHAPEDLADLLAEVERLRPRAALADAMIERVARDTAAKESFTSRRQWEDIPRDERTYLRAHAHRVLAADLTPQEGA